ncbi:MAG: hypothetical protein A2V70_14790 [Planctomycetes bacterium RBG_13_63_9]|nr:MAG: hypothetical protein A2V70_14790 [Planctomycetes bacterium RBG_13_63_9]
MSRPDPFLVALALLVAEPAWRPAEPFIADPAAMLERFFGEERDEDREALARIEVSFAEERRMGETAVRAYLAELKRQKIRVLARGREVDYLRDLVETIRPLMDQRQRYRHINVYLAQSSRCDARSFPGGTLVFFRGLLESADSEAAVVGIVGHELSHLDRGHHLVRVRRMKLAQQMLSDSAQASSPDQFFNAGAALARIWMRPFRPEDEAEADRDGARWAYQVGYDPREMGNLFLRLRDRNRLQGLPIPSFLQTHPAPEDRNAEIVKLYGELQHAEPSAKLYIGKENLRRRVARVRRRLER